MTTHGEMQSRGGPGKFAPQDSDVVTGRAVNRAQMMILTPSCIMMISTWYNILQMKVGHRTNGCYG